MNREDIMLVMTVCELLKLPKTVSDIEKAYQNAEKTLAQFDRN